MKPRTESAIFRLGGLIVSATALVLSLPALGVMLLIVLHFTPRTPGQILWVAVTGGASLWTLVAGVIFQIRPRRWSYMLVISSLVLVPCVWVYWVLAFPPKLLH